jgi:hypothetical protein
MTALDDLLARAVADLRALGHEPALVGGLAVSARAEPRFTRDLDLAVAVADDRKAEALVNALALRGYRVVAVVEQETTGRMATVRLENRATPGIIVDLLLATTGIEAEIVRDAEVLRVAAGVQMRVAAIGHLIALKVLSADDRRRPQDRIDLKALFAVAGPADVQLAVASLRLITDRGCHRGRDLQSLFEQWRRELAG